MSKWNINKKGRCTVPTKIWKDEKLRCFSIVRLGYIGMCAITMSDKFVNVEAFSSTHYSWMNKTYLLK